MVKTKSLVFVAAILATVVLVSGCLGGDSSTGGATVNTRPEATGADASDTGTRSLSIDDDSVKGDADAPVTIIEFGDYECSYCARFYSNTLGELEKRYIETGKVKLVYKDFPLGFHKNAQKAAEAAECAGEQGKYWEMHDKLFDSRQLKVEDLKRHASDLELDTGQFNKCLDSGQMASEVKADLQEGRKAGVSGTPAFFINGKSLVGAQPFSKFKQVIEGEL